MRAAAAALVLIVACKGTEAPAPAPDPGPTIEDVRPVQVPIDAAAPASPVTVASDDRVELLALLERLAGTPEYAVTPTDGGLVARYRERLDAAFAKFATDPAVVMTKELRSQHGIGHDAPMQFAVHLDADRQLVNAAELAETDARWEGVDVSAYAAAVRQFAQTSKFDAFYAAEGKARTPVEAQARALANDSGKVIAYFDHLCGPQRGAKFVVVPSLVTGDWNYSAHATAADGSIAIYLVLGIPNGEGIPATGVVRNAAFDLLVHELGHSYVNPAVARHTADLTATGEALRLRSVPQMDAQAYRTGPTVLAESVVRAAVALYHDNPSEVAAVVAEQKARGFTWMPAMVEALRDVRDAHASDPAAAFDAFIVGLPMRFPPRP